MNAAMRIAVTMAMLSLGGGIAAVTPASAVAAPMGTEASGGTAPACIARVVDSMPDGQHVWVDNECGKTMHIKIIVNHGSDTGCNTLRNHQTREWILQGVSRYNRTVVC